MTGQEWYKEAMNYAKVFLYTDGEFTSDDITEALGMPPSPNTVGALMSAITQRLKLRKLRRVPSRRAQCHSAEVAVWGR